MFTLRRQILLGSLVLTTALIPGISLAAEVDAKPLTEALGKVRSAETGVDEQLTALAEKLGKVVMHAEVSPLAEALDELIAAEAELLKAWSQWSRGEHKDVDDKLAALTKNLAAFKTEVASLPSRGILSSDLLNDLYAHRDAARKLTNQIADRIAELTAS